MNKKTEETRVCNTCGSERRIDKFRLSFFYGRNPFRSHQCLACESAANRERYLAKKQSLGFAIVRKKAKRQDIILLSYGEALDMAKRFSEESIRIHGGHGDDVEAVALEIMHARNEIAYNSNEV